CAKGGYYYGSGPDSFDFW
nr:immunoglobulin heavy chain junction region [Macaca mulatta]MOX00017.1 immunoglobulin heavy chain junction region [Macaca mulatta]MOX01002.1 immunoglobulin heavy chain junction region [Macaca mulatta]MOX03000.1 immunoglobulin heavy chain junction region [Macaca mulatta]MOX06320.1 immunoglobulin heavy chain junction region [Macaca mulatta]